MDTVVAVAIGVLSIIFLGSLVALIFICRHKFCVRPDDLKPILKYSKNDKIELHSAHGTELLSSTDDLEDMYRIGPSIERILRDHNWVHDASGLITHCLAVLKVCHLVTDKLSGLSFSTIHGQQEIMDELRTATRRITPRADDLVRAMYPPLNAALLEARATTLVLAISNLILVFKSAFPHIRNTEWLADALKQMDAHLDFLRDAAMAERAQQQAALAAAGAAPQTTATTVASSGSGATVANVGDLSPHAVRA